MTKFENAIIQIKQAEHQVVLRDSESTEKAEKSLYHQEWWDCEGCGNLFLIEYWEEGWFTVRCVEDDTRVFDTGLLRVTIYPKNLKNLKHEDYRPELGRYEIGKNTIPSCNDLIISYIIK